MSSTPALIHWLRLKAVLAGPSVQIWLALAVALLAGILCFGSIKGQSGASETPIGCDNFGYFRQAKLFRDFGVPQALDTAIRDEISAELVRIAKSSGQSPLAWQEAVAPHCHHYKIATDKVILQYPPGTGFLLAAFPEGQRGRWLAHTASLVILAGLLMMIWNARSLVTLAGAATLAWLCFYKPTWFGEGWSVHPSLVCVLALGFLLATKLDFDLTRTGSRWHAAAGLILGLSINFRIPNGFMLAGFLATYGIAFLSQPSLRSLKAPITFGLGLLAGVLPVFAANAINAGSPFATTYSTVDAASPLPSAKALADGLEFFLVMHRKAGVFVGTALVPVIVFALATWRQPRKHEMLVLAAIAVNLATNLGYFLLHDPRAPYYPLPVAAFAASAAVFSLARMSGNHQAPIASRPLAVGLVLILLAVGVATALRPRDISPFYTDPATHASLDKRTVVWADLTTGYFHYFENRQSSKLWASSPQIQDMLIDGAARSGMTQVLVADSPTMRALIDRLKQQRQLEPSAKLYGYDAFVIRPQVPQQPRAVLPAATGKGSAG